MQQGTRQPLGPALPCPLLARKQQQPSGRAVTPLKPLTPLTPARLRAPLQSQPRPVPPAPLARRPGARPSRQGDPAGAAGQERGAGNREPPPPGAAAPPLPQQLPNGAADAAVAAEVLQGPLRHLHVLRHLGAAPAPSPPRAASRALPGRAGKGREGRLGAAR